MPTQSVSATLERDLLGRLDALAEETERNRSWLISKAVEVYLEELEDLRIAKERLHDERLRVPRRRGRKGPPGSRTLAARRELQDLLRRSRSCA